MFNPVDYAISHSRLTLATLLFLLGLVPGWAAAPVNRPNTMDQFKARRGLPK